MRSLVLAALIAAAPLSAAVVPTLAVAAAPANATEAEAVLRTTITAIQAGSPNFDSMSPELAAAVKAQGDASAQLAALGPVTAVERIGDGSAPYQFKVTFQAGIALNWSIGFDDKGVIIGLAVTQ
ncbi:MAG: hypothetical protein ACK4RV_15935 [Caulobacter sp.]|jgi:hypothetical protein